MLGATRMEMHFSTGGIFIPLDPHLSPLGNQAQQKQGEDHEATR